MTTCNSIRTAAINRNDLLSIANEQALHILGLLSNKLTDEIEGGIKTTSVPATHIVVSTVIDILDRANRGVE